MASVGAIISKLDPTRFVTDLDAEGGTGSATTQQILQESVDAFNRPGGLSEISDLTDLFDFARRGRDERARRR